MGACPLGIGALVEGQSGPQICLVGCWSRRQPSLGAAVDTGQGNSKGLSTRAATRVRFRNLTCRRPCFTSNNMSKISVIGGMDERG